MVSSTATLSANFIQNIIAEDTKTGKYDQRVHTRFPPEPNGYLHIGHAKSICLNFGIAADNGGLCNLRFDDTNPSKEEVEYVDSIQEDVKWLGFDWDDRIYYASDYFGQLYEYAEQLIQLDKAYVCDLTAQHIREFRGTLTEPGRNSPYRERTIQENLDLFRRMKGVQQQGAAALIHKNTGRKPSHALDESLISQIVSLKQSALYCDANFRHFCELLERRENITISYSSLHTLLSQAGLKSPKKRRRIKLHRRRKRKEQEGLLLQVDATPFEWFGGTEKFALHGAIDDATGKVAGLYLTKHECLHGYWELTRRLIRRHGIPASIYADRHAIFLSRNAGKLSLEDQLGGKVVNDTQFGRAMTELGITLIAARSPQAKGRVERLWDTLQSRLPIEFALAKITTIDQANDFLASYIESFNEQFAVVPIDSVCAFRPAPSDLDLDSILCIKMTRILDAGAVFSFYNRHFVLQPGKRRLELPAKTAISVLVSPLFGIRAQYKQTVFDVLPYIRETKSTEERNEVRKKSNWTPPDSHYFKYGHSLVKKLTFEDNNFDILHLLEDIFLKKYA